ncbi:MAG: hypothetical protein RBS40_13365 [Rhodocyclaceae bacterium]|jgi:hypothetical protein|nr:hypothetical protein [Rhodocyclaceae bacterium]
MTVQRTSWSGGLPAALRTTTAPLGLRSKNSHGSKQTLNAGGIRVRICPATSNLPTRMTRPAWDALCRSTQEREAGAVRSELGCTKNTHGHRRRLNWCAECQGKHLPPGLEFIDAVELAATIKQREGKTMGTTARKKGNKCANCGKSPTATNSCGGEQVCSSCASVIGSIRHRPEAVLRAIRKTAPELLGQPVQIEVESKALARIAEIVGYTGEDGDGLIAAIEAATAKPVEGPCERSEAMAGGLLDLARALGLPATTETPEEDIWRAAMQTAALREEAERQLDYTRRLGLRKNDVIRDQAAGLIAIKSAIGLLEDAEVSEIIGAIAELTQALGRFRNLAAGADERADRFAQAAEQAQSSADLLLAEKNLADERADVAEAQVTAIRAALQAQESDESTIEVAERRMVALAKLDKMYGESEARIGAAERRAEAMTAENNRLNDLLAAQNETVADYIDPYRQAMADFGLRVLRGEACLTFSGR